MNKDYKVEMKPTYWDVKLDKGCYSDHQEEHLYFNGNSIDEVWIFLCRYIESIWEANSDYEAIVMEHWDKKKRELVVEHQFATKGFTKKQQKRDVDIDWNTEYGYTWGVDITRLEVIYFNK